MTGPAWVGVNVGDVLPNLWGLPIAVEAVTADYIVGRGGVKWIMGQGDNGAARLEPYHPVAKFAVGDRVNIVIGGQLQNPTAATVTRVYPVNENDIFGYDVQWPDGTIAIYEEANLESATTSTAGPAAAVGSVDPPAALPLINVGNQHLPQISELAYVVLQNANNPPVIYQYGGQLARVATADGRPSIQMLDPATLRHRLERVAGFVKVRNNNGFPYTQPVDAPDRLIADILAYPEWPGMPALRGVVTAPVVAQNGEQCDAPGFNPATGLYYHADGLAVGDTAPTADRVAWAIDLIMADLLGDFPFKDEASRANAVGLLILPFARPLIEGVTPLHTINAPMPGTGKTLLSWVTTLPFNPEGPAVMTAGQDEDEWRKRITAMLSAGASHLVIDNLKGSLTSGSLAAALSTPLWTDRVLGKSQTITLPNRAVWIATGNNIAVDTELARRAVWIRLDANAERPWQRSGFRHAALQEWAIASRGDIVTAALILIRNWINGGRVPGRATVGGYEAWARVIGGILDAAGIVGFMGNIAELYEAADPSAALWSAFVTEWWNQFHDQIVGVKELIQLADSEPPEAISTSVGGEPAAIIGGLGLLDELLSGRTARARKIQLGQLLGGRVDTVVEGFKIEAAGAVKKTKTYRLVAAGG